jgi:hypothetical protein
MVREGVYMCLCTTHGMCPDNKQDPCLTDTRGKGDSVWEAMGACKPQGILSLARVSVAGIGSIGTCFASVARLGTRRPIARRPPPIMGVLSNKLSLSLSLSLACGAVRVSMPQARPRNPRCPSVPGGRLVRHHAKAVLTSLL